MQKPMRRLVISLVVVAMIVAAAQMAFQFVAEQNRDAKLAKLKRSTSFPAYKNLVSAISEKGTSAPVSEPESEDTSLRAALSEDALEAISLYERMALPREVGEIVYGKEPSQWTAEDVGTLAAYLDANRNVTREIRLLADQRETLRQYPWPQDSVSVARWLYYSAVTKAKAGDYAEAVEDIIAGMKIGDALLNVPISRSQSSGREVYHQMCDAIEESFHSGELSSDLISRLVTHMAEADKRQAFAESFIGEALTELQKFSGIRGADEEMREKLKEQLPSGGPISLTTTVGQFAGPLYIRLYTSPLGQPWRNIDEGKYAEIMNRVATAAQLPYYEARPQLYEVQNKFAGLSRQYRGVLADVPLHVPWDRFEQQAWHEAEIDLAQMGLLLEYYQAQHGSHPENLASIRGDLGGELPVDPFSGEPYHYRPSGETFFLYSVGPDRGGRQGDIVWRGEDEL